MSEPQRYILIKRFYGFRSSAGLTSTSLDIIARYAVRTCKGGCQYKNSKISGQTCDGLAHIFVKVIAFIYVCKQPQGKPELSLRVISQDSRI